jgi:hypothetical protein
VLFAIRVASFCLFSYLSACLLAEFCSNRPALRFMTTSWLKLMQPPP